MGVCQERNSMRLNGSFKNFNEGLRLFRREGGWGVAGFNSTPAKNYLSIARKN